MVEISETQAAVVGVYASPRVLGFLRPAEAYACRVALDETMFVSSPAEREALLRDSSAVSAGDPHAIVLDETDGWTVWSILGEDAGEAFGRLSHVPLRRGYLQGEVVGLPVRVVAGPGRIHLFVASMLGDCLQERLSRIPGVVEHQGPRSWVPEVSA
jgi:hypothetical protein